MIRLDCVTKRYGEFTAVRELSLHVPAGEVFGFLGPNGAGKTTTLRMLAGILRPTSGSIHIGGMDLLANGTEARRILGFIPDRPFVYEKLTGWEYLRFVAGLYGLWKGEDATLENRAMELLGLFDLQDWRHELVESYSHGMRQKLIIAAAFLHRPRVMVVDEPMVGLDPKSARILKDLFREYARRGSTILVSTHTLAVAESMCDRIGIIQGGTMRACGSMDELRADAVTAGDGLEEIFLRLTGERPSRELAEVLDA
jgi:ABC-2 type transport system ATP-binding protein